jgi:hypothetical protein
VTERRPAVTQIGEPQWAAFIAGSQLITAPMMMIVFTTR